MFAGKNPNNKLILQTLGPRQLSGSYTDAVADADTAVFESPYGGNIIQGTPQNVSTDDNCNHSGSTSNGRITFDQPGRYTLVYRVGIRGVEYEASITVTIKGRFMR